MCGNPAASPDEFVLHATAVGPRAVGTIPPCGKGRERNPRGGEARSAVTAGGRYCCGFRVSRSPVTARSTIVVTGRVRPLGVRIPSTLP